jgi:hypothetical protein
MANTLPEGQRAQPVELYIDGSTAANGWEGAPKYSAFPLVQFTIDATTNPALDFYTITNPGGCTGYLHEVWLTGSATAATNIVVQLHKRSSANAGGTSALVAKTKFDTNTPDALCVVRQYTDVAVGTSFVAGASAGVVFTRLYVLDRVAPAGIGVQALQAYTFAEPVPVKPGETLALSMPAALGPAGNVVLPGFIWSEVRS